MKPGSLRRPDVTGLGAVLAGETPGRQSKDEVTAFDSTGLAIEDRAIVLAATEHAGRLDLQKLAL